MALMEVLLYDAIPDSEMTYPSSDSNFTLIFTLILEETNLYSNINWKLDYNCNSAYRYNWH